jgi:hypothetical protein
LGRLAIGLAVAAAMSAAVGIWLLVIGSSGDDNTEVGKWLLALSSALLVAGAVSTVVRVVEVSRTERETWAERLHDVMAARDTVAMARLFLSAHATAKTYQDQAAELIHVRAKLRRLKAEPGVAKDRNLLSAIDLMLGYLDDLGREYEACYLTVARQQLLDEAWLKKRVADEVSNGVTEIPPS